MGCVFSSSSLRSTAVTPAAAKVVPVNGALRQYSVPVTAGHVLKREAAAEDVSEKLFVCNSDTLYFDEKIPALDASDSLQAGQIYFVLPSSKLHYPLTAADMAAMAVKASEAMREGEGKLKGRGWGRRKRRKVMQISPVLLEAEESGVGDSKKRFGVERSGSVRRLHRSASRRAKMAYRSFRAKLSTIHEGSVSESS
ncbi:hypothetical protein ACLOJK_041458 [Asimina triloba]